MVVSGILLGLASVACVVACLVLAIVTLVRGLTSRVKREAGPTCGRCGYGIDIARSTGVCTECGSELGKVGIFPARAYVKLRASALQVYTATAVIMAAIGFIAGYAAIIFVTFSAGGMFGGGMAPMVFSGTADIACRDPGRVYDLRFVADVEQDFTGGTTGATGGTIVIAASTTPPADALTSPRLEVVAATGAWTVYDAEGLAGASGASFDAAAFAELLDSIGVASEGPAFDAEADMLVNAVTSARLAPSTIPGQTLLLTPIAPASATVTWVGGATVTGGPMGLVTAGSGVGAAVGGVWLVTTVAAFGAVAWRRTVMLRG